MDAMIRALLQGGNKVCVLAVHSNKFSPGKLPEELASHPAFSLHTAYIDLALKPTDALVNLFKGRSYHISRFYSKAFTTKLRSLLHAESFDIVQFETPFLGLYLPMIREHSDAKVVLRAHNLEHRIWQRLAKKERNPLKKWYLGKLSQSLKKFEFNFSRKCDAIMPITEKDADWFRSMRIEHVHAFPFGMQFADAQMPTDISSGVFHLGSMDWMPNQEGIEWFLEHVWPLVISQDSGLQLHLAGRNMPDSLKQKQQEGVVIHGEIPDAGEFMRNYGIMIVPLLSGSGMRIKIIEGMTEGRAIVSTTIGAEGIECENEENILLADDAESFATAILRLTTDERLRMTIGQNAFSHVRKVYDLSRMVPGLMSFYERIISEE